MQGGNEPILSEQEKRWRRRIERERAARRNAEQCLEEKSFELYLRNQELRELTKKLEQHVNDRTAELLSRNAELEETKNLWKLAAQDAHEATRAKSDFLASISHEIRTPLNGVVGMIHLLESTELNEQQRRFVNALGKSSDSVISLIDNILDLSKFEAGKLTLEQRPFSWPDLMEEVAILFFPMAQKKGIEIRYHCYPGAWQEVVGDRHRLRQILTNLIGNAVKFTHKGEIEIGADRRESPDGKAALEIWVKDTGIGIPKAAQASLFKPFVQADSSTTRKFGGTGLGLSICRNLIDLFGGTITIDSEEGKGSTFKLSIPFPRMTALAWEAEADQLAEQQIGVRVSDERDRAWIEYWLLRWHCNICSRPATPEVERLRGILIIEQHAAIAEVSSGKGYCSSESDVSLVLLCSLSKTAKVVAPSLGQELARIWKPINPQQLLQALLGRSVERNAEGKSDREPIPDLNYSDRKVLLVDDSVTNRLVATELLALWHIAPDIARNGAEAIQLARARRYDLILMDCMMPEVDGFEAAKCIRSDTPACLSRETPIVALTANTNPVALDQCLEAGMSGHLSKPLHPDNFYQTVQDFLECRPDRAGSFAGAASASQADRSSLLSFDPKRLLDLFSGNESIVRKLLPEFIEDANQHLVQIEQALGDVVDLESVRLHAHSLRGSASEYGACGLSMLAGSIEDASEVEDKAKVDACLPGAKEAFHETEAAIGRFLEGDGL